MCVTCWCETGSWPCTVYRGAGITCPHELAVTTPAAAAGTRWTLPPAPHGPLIQGPKRGSAVTDTAPCCCFFFFFLGVTPFCCFYVRPNSPVLWFCSAY
jgi:hypothetical protein